MSMTEEEEKDRKKAYRKSWYQAHKDEQKARCKAYRQSHKEKYRDYHRKHYKGHQEEYRDYHSNYNKDDVNSSGKTKNSVRCLSLYYLSKYGTKILGYEIHHCFTYDDPKKFIYCSRETHLLIHAYLMEHNIDADSDHYEQIKHLLDDTVVLYGITNS